MASELRKHVFLPNRDEARKTAMGVESAENRAKPAPKPSYFSARPAPGGVFPFHVPFGYMNFFA